MSSVCDTVATVGRRCAYAAWAKQSMCLVRAMGIRKKMNNERWSWIRMTIVNGAVLESIWTRNKLELNLRISAIKFNFSFTTCNNT